MILTALPFGVALAQQAGEGASSPAAERAGSTQKVLIQGERVPLTLVDNAAGRVAPGDSAVSMVELSTRALEAPGNVSLAHVLATVPSIGENFAAVGYYENFTIRGFTLDMGSAFRVNGMIVPGEWHFPLDSTAAVEVLSGVGGAGGGLVGGGGTLNLVTHRATRLLRGRLEVDGRGGSHVLVDAGQVDGVVDWRATASTVQMRPEYPQAKGHRSFVGIAMDAKPRNDLRLYLDASLQRRAQPVVPGFQLLGGRTPPDLAVRGVNLNAQPWSRPVTNDGSLGMVRAEGEAPFGLKWEAGASRARAKIDDNLATPFGCNTPPFEFFCGNGDYVLYDYHAAERRSTTHVRASGSLPLNAFGLRHELRAGVERIDRTIDQREVYSSTSYDAEGNALSGNIFEPDRLLPQPVSAGVDRPQVRRSQRAVFLTHATRAGNLASVVSARWVEVAADDLLPRHRYLLPRLALNWRLAPTLEVFTSLARGLEFGSEAPVTAANAGEVLSPRVTRQVEIGLRRHVEVGLRYAVTAFRSERPWEFVEPTGGSWAGLGPLVQRGQQRHTGVEASFEWRFSPGATFEGRFSVLDAKGSGSGRANRDGMPLQNIPKAGMHVRLEQPVGFVPGLSYNAAVTARSSKAATADGAVPVGGFALIGAGLSWQVPWTRRAISVDVGVRNLADRRYWRDAGQAYSADLLFPGAARSVSVLLRMDGMV